MMEKEERQKKVAHELNKYFKSQGYTQAEIQKILGYQNRIVVANYLHHGRFGKKAAERWSKSFGFNPEYLTSGEGRMFLKHSAYKSFMAEFTDLQTIVRMQKRIIEQLQKKISELEAQVSKK